MYDHRVKTTLNAIEKFKQKIKKVNYKRKLLFMRFANYIDVN